MNLRPDAVVRIAGVLALVVTAGLLVRLAAIGNLRASFIIAAPGVAGVMALLWPRPGVAFASLVLLLVGMLPLLFGGLGLLYLPAILLLFAAGPNAETKPRAS